jgi:diguanylate cyclase (GGDEF)-like protein
MRFSFPSMRLPSLPWPRFKRPSDAVYVELVDALFSLIPPIVVFSICLSAVGLAVTTRTGDVAVAVLTIAGLLVSGERILMVRRYRRSTTAGPLSPASARIWEKRFTIRSVATALIVSVIGTRCLMLPYPSVHMLIIGLLVAFAAGIITRVAYRPRLALFNLLVISLPAIAACLIHGGPLYHCVAFVMSVFLFGGFETVQHLYATIVSQLTLKLSFAGLARLDPLTGLSNRLVLNENLERMLAHARRNDVSLAIHSLDLNHFKAANDRFGHPVGDALLQEVAKRLRSLTHESDLLVRLGGDEFVLVQAQVKTREQSLARAARIVEEIGAAYRIKGNDIKLGTSVGIVITADEDLTAEELLTRADQALYQAKRSGGDFAVYAPIPQLVPSLPNSDELPTPWMNAG